MLPPPEPPDVLNREQPTGRGAARTRERAAGYVCCDDERVWQAIADFSHRAARDWLPMVVGVLFLVFQKQLADFVKRGNIRGQGLADTHPRLFFGVAGLVFLVLGVLSMVGDLR